MLRTSRRSRRCFWRNKAYRSGKRSDENMNVIVKPLTTAYITDLAVWFASIAIKAKSPT